MFFTASMTFIIWFNLLLCIASGKNETFSPTNLKTGDEGSGISGISDSFNILYYTNFEPLFGSEFPSDPSQLIDFVPLSEIEETDLLRNAPYPGFSNSYGFIGHTNLEASLGTDMDSYRNVREDVNGELKTNNNEVRYPSITEQSALPIYFHQVTLSSDGISGQHGNAEQSNISNKHFSNSLNILDYRGNTDEGSETGYDKLLNNFSFYLL
ncbi:unnamed protein product [Brugia timori]|uniref:Uncharacterized protein n=1 Tax=Brugia timori TaxID=42155 RepID=A0A0R3Q3Y4_9BILA|nr:unnamed protein product [Brugia timori]